ncbi:MAG: hypothetical protein MK193_14060 [Lentisphaeria bacterium]|nr:hypothetical protein [Lentisphaeria bacterium]
MSALNYIFDNEWNQRRDIENLQKELDRTHRDRIHVDANNRRALESQAYLAEDLLKEVEELAIINKALLRLLIEKEVITGQELEQMIRTVDLEDGVEDGKITKERKRSDLCPSCSHKMNPERPSCLYCGYKY